MMQTPDNFVSHNIKVSDTQSSDTKVMTTPK